MGGSGGPAALARSSQRASSAFSASRRAISSGDGGGGGLYCAAVPEKKAKERSTVTNRCALENREKRCKNKTTNTAGLAWGWVWLLAACTAHLWLLFFPCVRRNAQRATVTNVETRKECGKKCVTPSHNNKQKKMQKRNKAERQKKGQTQRQKSFVQLECG